MSIEKKSSTPKYYFAPPSFWPLVGSVGLFLTLLGFVQILHHDWPGPYLLLLGVVLLLMTLTGWFGVVIHESESGMHNAQLSRSYRWGMIWFIVSEVALFSVFFGALFYIRQFALPELGNATGSLANQFLLSEGAATHHYLWPTFQAVWPLLINPNPKLFTGPSNVIPTWGVPAFNTLILMSSAVAVTWAHWGLLRKRRRQLVWGLIFTIVLGILFEVLQIIEYYHAYANLGLTLNSGIYGSTFYTLTGLHAMHVTIGIMMLSIILIRVLRGHFSPGHHFGFQAVSWYWHFVDIVWIFLFIFVYWI